jgi:hypothetical protein
MSIIIELLSGGVGVAQQAGEALLGSTARSLWTEALRKAPSLTGSLDVLSFCGIDALFS